MLYERFRSKIFDIYIYIYIYAIQILSKPEVKLVDLLVLFLKDVL